MGAWGRTKLLCVKSLIPVLHNGCDLPNYSSFLSNVFFNCRCHTETRYFDCDFSCLSSLLSVVALRTSEGSLLSHSVIFFCPGLLASLSSLPKVVYFIISKWKGPRDAWIFLNTCFRSLVLTQSLNM